jgi:hypothetical protein
LAPSGPRLDRLVLDPEMEDLAAFSFVRWAFGLRLVAGEECSFR